jgi:hypothetical protein
MASPRWRLGLAGLALLAVVCVRAADPPKPAPDAKAPPEEPRSPVDGPAGLTQKELQELLDEIARLRAQLKAERPESPSKCKVSGHAGADTVQLALEFEFRTFAPKARVALGCGQGFPSRAELDGHPPLLKWGPDGLFVQVEEPGDHKLSLEMILPLAVRESKPAERGFDLDLPAAPTTVVDDFKLPAGVKKVRSQTTLRDGPSGRQVVKGEHRTEPGRHADAEVSRLKTAGLGPVERLELTWEAQAPDLGAGRLLAVENAQVVVRVDEKHVVTQADLTLVVRRGQTAEWELLVPPEATVRLPMGDPRDPVLDPPDAKGPRRVIRFAKGPSAEPLTVGIDVQQPRTGQPVPIGPFVVPGAFPQRGEVFISAPADMDLSYQPRGGSQYVLTRRELTEEEKKRSPNAVALRYGATAVPGEPPVPQFLDLDADRRKGQVEARVSHVLRLVTGDAARPPGWRLTTTIRLDAFHTEVEALRVRLPADFEFDDRVGLSPAGKVSGPEWVGGDAGHRLAEITFTPRGKGEFAVTFEGRYSRPAGPEGQASLELPVPVGPLDRGATVTVSVPDDRELVPPRAGPLWGAGKPEAPGRRIWSLEQQPERFEVAWRPFRPDLAVEGKVQVVLSGSQASVTHQLWLAPGQLSGGALLLRVPEEVNGLAVVGAGENGPRLESRGGDTQAVVLPAAPDRERPLTLRYSFRVPGRAAPFAVPLVVPEQATRGETRVLVWTDPGTRPELGEGRWEQRLEEVKGVDRYPSLIAVAPRPDAPLALRLPDGGSSLASFRVEKGLVQVTVADSGQQAYRARYLLSQVAAPFADVELPAPLFQERAGNVKVTFRGKAAAWYPIDEDGQKAAASKLARVTLEPDPEGKPGVLEVVCVLAPGRTSGSSALRSTLQPPVLKGDAGVAPVRWQVTLPPSWVPLYHEGGLASGHRWGVRGWLLAAEPDVTPAELERWFSGSDQAGSAAAPALVLWHSGWEPVRLAHAPQRAWLLLCSLGLLVIGLGLTFVALPRIVFWGVLASLCGAALVTGVVWPGLFAAVLDGCQPGALVLVPVVALQWVLLRRYRRRVVFLPSFARLKGGSSLTRAGGSTKPREPSTVDGPPGNGQQAQAGSSVSR